MIRRVRSQSFIKYKDPRVQRQRISGIFNCFVEIKTKNLVKDEAFLCERAVKRCVNAGKNSKKYTRKLLDKLEFI